MRVADVLRELGRPIAYYPFLARYLGGVNATVFFCQIFYWQDKATSELGVHKTSAELEGETGLSYEEQRSARAALRASGVLIETEKRIEHKIYFRVDEDALEQLLAAGPSAKKPSKARKSKAKAAPEAPGESPLPEMGKVHSGESEKSIPGNGESPVPEMDKPDPPNLENPPPPTGQNLVRGEGSSQVVNEWVTTTETTAATRASDAVDNSAAAAANLESEKPDTEGELTALLIALERDRGKELTIDKSRDRAFVLTWVGKGVTAEQLRAAHRLAVKSRKRDSDDRPTYAGFVSTFIDAEAAAPSAPSAAPADPDWWLAGEEVLLAAGERFGARPKRRDEPLPLYRAVVARAAGKGPWIDAILRDAQRGGGQFQQMIVATLGEALLPVDWYAS